MLRLIGDIHVKYNIYSNIIKGADYSVQLGDFGFEYDVLAKVDSSHHRIIPGNHDNYDRIHEYPNHIFQNDYGMFEVGGVRFCYIRGELSVDKKYRVENVSWWKQEEMSYKSGLACINFVERYKPNIILSHGCPVPILQMVATNRFKVDPSWTTQVLTYCFKVHKPEYWFFGHHHQDWYGYMFGTHFRCIGPGQFTECKGYFDYVPRNS